MTPMSLSQICDVNSVSDYVLFKGSSRFDAWVWDWKVDQHCSSTTRSSKWTLHLQKRGKNFFRNINYCLISLANLKPKTYHQQDYIQSNCLCSSWKYSSNQHTQGAENYCRTMKGFPLAFHSERGKTGNREQVRIFSVAILNFMLIIL